MKKTNETVYVMFDFGSFVYVGVDMIEGLTVEESIRLRSSAIEQYRDKESGTWKPVTVSEKDARAAYMALKEKEEKEEKAAKEADAMKELEEAAALAIRRYPGDWKKAGHPAPADLIGAAWIKLQERGDGDMFRAACSALSAEAWQHSGHSVGGSVDHLTGLEDYDGAATSDRAESAAALNADAMRRDTESAALAGVILEDVAADPLDRAIIRAQLAGLTQAETAAALNVTRATVNRRLQAIRRRLEDAAKI